MTEEHVDSFKQQMVDVIRYAKENPESISRLGGSDDDTGLIASSLSDVVDGDGATHTSVSVDVTRASGTQPIPITLSVAAAHDGIPHYLDNLSQPALGRQSLLLNLSSDTRKPGCSSSAEMSSDAEYYTPFGSPDESQHPLAVNSDELAAASLLTATVIGKVINWS